MMKILLPKKGTHNPDLLLACAKDLLACHFAIGSIELHYGMYSTQRIPLHTLPPCIVQHNSNK